jgi:hypothetical protein
MHCPQMLAYSDAKGIAHIMHDGPENLFICDQQELQTGAWLTTSGTFPHTGHREG